MTSSEEVGAVAAAAMTTASAAPSALVDFIAGTAGGIASLLAGHPFDTVKTRLQAQPASSSSCSLLPHKHDTPSIRSSTAASSASKLVSSCRIDYASTIESRHAIPASAAHSTAIHIPHMASSSTRSGGGAFHVTLPIYRSATDAFRIIIREERLSGLYKGVTSPMLGVAIMNASIFGLYNISLRYQESHHVFSDHAITQVLIAGMLSGLGSSLITSPIDLIKIREQMDTTRGKTTWSVFKHVVKTEGVRRGVYRGWCTTAIRDLGYGPYFASYEWLNGQIQRYTGKPLTNLDMAMSGAVAGVVAWLSTFWADVIKTKIQATNGIDDVRGRSLFWSTAKHTYRQGGWRAFFVGVGPTVLRALPVNAVLFVTYEATKDLLISRGF